MELFYSNQSELVEIKLNLTQLNLNDDMINLVNSLKILINSRVINIFATMCITVIGLIGNLATMCIFAHKKYRLNSSHVYLLSLALIDTLFLVNHFFEDTLHAYSSMYLTSEYDTEEYFRIYDNPTLCRLLNYFRYSFRFASTYIMVAFTIQRLSIVYRPLSVRFKSKMSAWKTVMVIGMVSLVSSAWVPFMFQMHETNQKDDKFCDVDKGFRVEYFNLNGIYIVVIILFPLFTILICNSMIIRKTCVDDQKRKVLIQIDNNSGRPSVCSNVTRRSLTSRKSFLNDFSWISNMPKNVHLKSFYSTFEQKESKKIVAIKGYSKKVTISLTCISFSYVILNLPFLITCFLYFYEIAFQQLDTNTKNYLFATFKISEIFYVLNFSIKFYVYVCSNGSILKRKKRVSKSSGKLYLCY